MGRYETIFLDRDGTINRDPGYISSLENYTFYPFIDYVLKELSVTGKSICIVTNQSGVGRGLIDPVELDRIHDYVKEKFEKAGVKLLGIYFCADHPDQATDRRKPGVGMFMEAIKDHEIDLKSSIIIGDGLTDMKAGFNLGIDSMLVLTGHGLRTKKVLKDSNWMPTFVTRNLKTGLKYLK